MSEGGIHHYRTRWTNQRCIDLITRFWRLPSKGKWSEHWYQGFLKARFPFLLVRWSVQKRIFFVSSALFLTAQFSGRWCDWGVSLRITNQETLCLVPLVFWKLDPHESLAWHLLGFEVKEVSGNVNSIMLFKGTFFTIFLLLRAQFSQIISAKQPWPLPSFVPTRISKITPACDLVWPLRSLRWKIQNQRLYPQDISTFFRFWRKNEPGNSFV